MLVDGEQLIEGSGFLSVMSSGQQNTRQACKRNITLRGVGVTTVAVGKQ
jgi:hypothetical protein